jgi:hypothetical protein
MASPILNLNSSNIKDLVYVKTNIGGWFFDAFLEASHVSKIKITEHPVQTGASISDHAYLEPKELIMKIGMSDTAKSIVPGQFTGGWSRSSTAFKVLRELQALRIPLQVLTRLGVYKNMLIEVISTTDTLNTLFGLVAEITFKEIIVVKTTTVKLSARPQTTGATSLGTPEPIQPNQSILKQLKELLGF